MVGFAKGYVRVLITGVAHPVFVREIGGAERAVVGIVVRGMGDGKHLGAGVARRPLLLPRRTGG
jgi:hypothetical protein